MSSATSSWLFSALAAAESISLAMSRAAPRGEKRSSVRASLDRQAADLVGDQARLARGDPHVAGAGADHRCVAGSCGAFSALARRLRASAASASPPASSPRLLLRGGLLGPRSSVFGGGPLPSAAVSFFAAGFLAAGFFVAAGFLAAGLRRRGPSSRRRGLAARRCPSCARRPSPTRRPSARRRRSGRGRCGSARTRRACGRPSTPR